MCTRGSILCHFFGFVQILNRFLLLPISSVVVSGPECTLRHSRHSFRLLSITRRKQEICARTT